MKYLPLKIKLLKAFDAADDIYEFLDGKSPSCRENLLTKTYDSSITTVVVYDVRMRRHQVRNAYIWSDNTLSTTTGPAPKESR